MMLMLWRELYRKAMDTIRHGIFTEANSILMELSPRDNPVTIQRILSNTNRRSY